MTEHPAPTAASLPSPDPTPTAYTCRVGRYPDSRHGRRHRVITGDGICVRCGARGVVDASTLPTATTEDETIATPAELAL